VGLSGLEPLTSALSGRFKTPGHAKRRPPVRVNSPLDKAQRSDSGTRCQSTSGAGFHRRESRTPPKLMIAHVGAFASVFVRGWLCGLAPKMAPRFPENASSLGGVSVRQPFPAWRQHAPHLTQVDECVCQYRCGRPNRSWVTMAEAANQLASQGVLRCVGCGVNAVGPRSGAGLTIMVERDDDSCVDRCATENGESSGVHEAGQHRDGRVANLPRLHGIRGRGTLGPQVGA
jgi:hypothetical protein